jgi:hypothetical protein
MKPIECNVLATSAAEHDCRDKITAFLAAADETPDKHADHGEFRRLHETWLVARDAQRLAQATYADHLAASVARHPAGTSR